MSYAEAMAWGWLAVGISGLLLWGVTVLVIRLLVKRKINVWNIW